MTNIPAAWYPDPSGSAQRRWWDGTQWTEHLAPGEPQRPTPTSSNTPFIWVVVLVPLLSLIGLFAWDIDAYMKASLNPDLNNPLAAFSPGYFLALGLSGLSYLISVVFAWLDVRALRARGIDRPFHWAWCFLGLLIYVIGRTVIIRRYKLPAFAPLWVFIGVYVLTFIISLVRVGTAVANTMGSLSSLY